MSCETIIYTCIAFFCGSICVTAFLCLLFYRLEQSDRTDKILDGLREPLWKTEVTKKPTKDGASHD